MNDHIPVFGGLSKAKEKHLLSPGELYEAVNVRMESGIPRTRRGFVPILHFPSIELSSTDDRQLTADDASLLWPTCLPFIPVRNQQYSNKDSALPRNPFTSWQPQGIVFITYSSFTIRRGALKSLYNGQGGFADCHNVSGYPPSETVDKYRWSVRHFGF